MKTPTLLTIAGTRPEVLKLAPLIRRLRAPDSRIHTKTCFSGQHTELLESVLGDLGIEPDLDFRMPAAQRTLSQSLAWLMERIDEALTAERPDGVVVQGDTNTVLAGAMVAHHHRLPVFHVEAGLRTSDPQSPFPEEMNRRLVSRLAALHFAPTAGARENLLLEGVAPEAIEVTGNTGLDALHMFGSRPSAEAQAVLARTRPSSRKLLVTLHRRENAPHVAEVTSAIRSVLQHNADVEVVWILHLNGIRHDVRAALGAHPAVHLLEPQSYATFVPLMQASHFILTDSGGVQEEAPVFGKPVLVLREETERSEAIEAGCAKLVGCSAREIVRACRELLDDPAAYAQMSRAQSPFGDGRASERIVDALVRFYYPAPAARPIPTVRPAPSVAPSRFASDA